MARMKWPNIVAVVTAPFLGLAALVLPRVGSARDVGLPFLEVARRSLDGYGASSALLLVVVGVGLGVVSSVPAWQLGLAAIAALPVLSILRIIADPTSDNLLGIEWVLYFFQWAPVFVGAEIYRRLSGRGSRAPQAPEAPASSSGRSSE